MNYHALVSQLISQGDSHLFKDIQRGIEKEGLRASTEDGSISHSPHPHCLGSALTHSKITTDYSEALLELITTPHYSTEDALDELTQTHKYVYSCLKDEIMWPGSMPTPLKGETDIPIAEYGKSNIGHLKHVYRHGLAWRYGRIMQSIAGIHYNFSLPEPFWIALYELSDKSLSLQDFRSGGYIALIRNFRRYAWALSYLFGASPALDTSFFEGKEHKLQPHKAHTAYHPYATCLRMTDLGYKSSAQSSISLCYNHINTYTQSLSKAMHETYPEYENIGVKIDGKYRQLNHNLLQIENEFYSEIRPKRAPQSGEKALNALIERGVEYIEVRLLDLNPYLPLGIDSHQTRFIDTFLLHCLLQASPGINEEECNHIDQNLYNTALNGRHPEHTVTIHGETKPVKDACNELLLDMKSTALLLDNIKQQSGYSLALNKQLEKIDTPSKLPSQKLVDDLTENNLEFSELMLQLGKNHKALTLESTNESDLSEYKSLAEQSHKKQAEIESNDDISFDDFLESYLAS